MIMIVAMIYIFLSYLIFDQQWKLTFRKSSGPPWKSPLPPKNSKIARPRPFCEHWKFSRNICRRGGTLCKNTTCTKDTALNGSEITDIYEVIIFLCFHFWIKHINNYSRLSYILNVLFYVLKFSQFSFCKCSTNL